ncbi:unnamed protein product [Blepharisma stoltei]|uniref:Uncharacterized protein n=1 Tax=Blepharisma stoltei TaxID=1481888 RepID=A0AAU9J2E0_9CILI|nr:unnamed protein product [Blepharisma stoltei]
MLISNLMYEKERLPLAYTTNLKQGALGSLRSTGEGFFQRTEIFPFLNNKSMSITDLKKGGILDPQTSLQNASIRAKIFNKNTESCDLWKTKLVKQDQMMGTSRKDGYPYNRFTPLGPHIEAPNKSRNPKFYRTLSSDTWAFHKDMGEFTYFNIAYMKNNACFPYLKKKSSQKQNQSTKRVTGPEIRKLKSK